MSALIFFITTDARLAAEWERQMPPGMSAIRHDSDASLVSTVSGIAAVAVLDLAAEALFKPALHRMPLIVVGEPRSSPFEQARLNGRGKAYLSYEESAVRLGEVLSLVAQLAEKQSMIDLMVEKTRRTDPAPATVRPWGEPSDPAEMWDFIEAVVENLDSRDRLLAEFRRASRTLLHASHAVFFLREPAGFRADRGTSFFPEDDPIVPFFEMHPAVIDGNIWGSSQDPVAELAVRNRLALWGARLLVPIHDNGRLLGLIAFGVRDDGKAYVEGDRGRAVFIARLLRHCLVKSAQWARYNLLAEQMTIGSKYLPSSLLLRPDENPPRHVPVVVRELLGQARKLRQVCRVAPTDSQPFRATAGMIAETGGAWATWEEASAEIQGAAERERSGRKELLRELALTLSHEVGNALVSLATLRQMGGANPPAGLLETAKTDIAKLERLNRQLGLLQSLHESEVSLVDLRELAQRLGNELKLKVEVGPEPVRLTIASELVDFALRSLIDVISENRAPQGTAELVLQVRSTGDGDKATALISVQGRRLELEGILPEPAEGAVPNQGRLEILLAKEVIRLHRGEIHAGPGMQGTEILISLRSLPGRAAGAPPEVQPS
jgi:hypothetical protein